MFQRPHVNLYLAKCVDEYVKLRIHNSRNPSEPLDIDRALEIVVEKMFERSFNDGEYKSAIGIALQSRRTDMLEKAIKLSGKIPELLQYTSSVCSELVSLDYRPTALRTLVSIYEELETPDYLNVARCLVFLDDAKGIAHVLTTLIHSPVERNTLLAYQIAFELCDNGTQHILKEIRNILDPHRNDSIETIKAEELSPEEQTLKEVTNERMKMLDRILSTEPTIEQFLQFLYKKNHSDLGILKAIKSSFDQKNSILHNATITANGLMHSGTTRDTFLRDNLEWLGRATNWAKFSATASLGVIHKGHLKESMKVLGPYLPEVGASGSPYSEGGSLFALGLIHSNHGMSEISNGQNVCSYLLNQIRENSANEVILHGAALGLGVAGMASGDIETYEELVNVIYSHDNAVAGEAAGYALGLIMLGQAPENISDILNFAHDTEHEKIIRGIAMGLALMYYGKEEQAEPMIEQLITDKDPILRYGAAFMIGMAYGGTSNNNAIRRLLHTAVSDVNDDVRRAAVMNLGFVLFRQPEQVPKLVSLLAESYNPSVRYGACLAIGIACAGTGSKEAYDILMPMAKDDLVDTVRQGAMIALSMVFIQISDTRSQEVRKVLKEKTEDKHESVMGKLGAILGSGIIDAGGRNVTIALRSRAGHKNMLGMVGLALFLQYWYWYPLSHFISLAFSPTAVIGLNKDLKMPKFTFMSNAPPSRFAYPPDVKPQESKKEVKVTKVVLAASKRAKKGSKKSKKEEEMQIEEPEKKEEIAEQEKMDLEEQKKKEVNEVLENPARVTRLQQSYITFNLSDRYVPVTQGTFGIVMLEDLKKGEPEDLIDDGVPQVEEETEPEPPEAFKFLG